MRKSTAKQRQEIFNTIYGVSIMGSFNKRTKKTTPNSVLSLFEKDYNSYKNRGINKILELYKKYSYAIFFMYSPSSIRNNLVAFKNIIKANGGKYQANALEAFNIDSIYLPIKAKDDDRRERIAEKALDTNKTDKVSKEDVIKQIEVIQDKLETKSYSVSRNQKENMVRAYLILPLLSITGGRRFVENMQTLEVSKKGTKLTFEGLVKGNNKSIEGNLIGISYKNFKMYLGELRTTIKTDGMSEDEVSKKYSKVFNNALKRFAKDGTLTPQIVNYFTSVKRERKGVLIDGEANLKGFRDIYATVGAKIFHDPKKDRDYTQTASRILGHKYIVQSAEGYINK